MTIETEPKDVSVLTKGDSQCENEQDGIKVWISVGELRRLLFIKENFDFLVLNLLNSRISGEFVTGYAKAIQIMSQDDRIMFTEKSFSEEFNALIETYAVADSHKRDSNEHLS